MSDISQILPKQQFDFLVIVRILEKVLFVLLFGGQFA
jgi:hypothetical protein